MRGIFSCNNHDGHDEREGPAYSNDMSAPQSIAYASCTLSDYLVARPGNAIARKVLYLRVASQYEHNSTRSP